MNRPRQDSKQGPPGSRARISGRADDGGTAASELAQPPRHRLAVVVYPVWASRRYACTKYWAPDGKFVRTGDGWGLSCDGRVDGVLQVSQIVSVRSARPAH